ncbi:MAG: tRNA preQ1(34) S-adenosylmethionine ribosyltransferase-isomerase QueA [candidate division WOR-3 bacterium]
MKRSDFSFKLPKELIAQYPKEKGSSRLMVLDRETGGIEHRKFSDIVEYVRSGDCFVINNSKVIPARLIGYKSQGGEIEILLIEEIEERLWKAMVFPGKRVKVNNVIFINDKVKCKVKEIDEKTGERFLEFNVDKNELLRYGEIPLPPYIKRAPSEEDKNYYQTVYAKIEGSIAAPTAGLHFSEEILEKLKENGVKIAEITLHIGPGTFKPIRTENIENHEMESEWFKIDREAVSIIEETKKEGRSVFAIGTTTVRVLETVAVGKGRLTPREGRTSLFIYPPYEFKIVDHLLTNFHLPETTLLILVAAFASREMIFKCYREAIKEKYMFYSYGDAMLIL